MKPVFLFELPLSQKSILPTEIEAFYNTPQIL